MKNSNFSNFNHRFSIPKYLNKIKFQLILLLITTLTVSGVNAATYFSQGTNGFSVLTNWNTISGGGGANPIAVDLTSGLHNFIIQDGHTITIDQNISILNLTVGQGATGGLYVGDATSRVVTVNGTTIINTGASVLTGVFSASHTVTFRDNITNNGTLDLFSDLTMNTNTVLNQTTISIGGTGSYEFYGLSLAGTTNATLLKSIAILGAVNIPTGCILNGGSFTHQVAGDWTEVGTGQLISTGTIEFVGGSFGTIPVQSITTGSAVSFNNLNINGTSEIVIFNGTVTVLGNFQVNGNSTVSATNGQSHIVGGNFNVSIGSAYTQIGGTLTFNGTTTQNIDFAFTTIAGLAFSNGGLANPKNITSDIIAVGLVTINAGANVVSLTGNHTFNNGFRVDGVCNFGGSISFGGGSVSSINPTVDFGTANLICSAGTTSFFQVTPASPITFNINNDFTVSTGAQAVFGVCANSGVMSFVGNGSNNLTCNGNLYIRGANGFPTNFNSYNFGAASTTFYDCNFAQLVRGNVSYHNLTLNSSTFANAKTIDGPLDINGTLSIGGAGCNANLIGYNINIAGNHSVANSCAFVNDGTVTYDNLNGAQTIGTAGSTGTLTYENISIILDNPTTNWTKTINSNLTIGGNYLESNINGGSTNQLTVNLQGFLLTNDFDGQFILSDYTQIHVNGLNNFKPSMTSFGSKNLSVLSTVLYNNTTQNSIQIIADGFSYGNLSTQGSGAGFNYKSAAGSLDINGNFLIIGGRPIFEDGTFSHSIGGNYNIRTDCYTPSSCGVTITFDGDFQNIGAGFSDMTFPNVVFTGTGTKTFTSQTNYSLNVNCNLTIDNNVTVDANSKNINISGNFINSGSGTFIQTTGYSVRFIGTTLNQTVSSSPNSYFGGITINKPTVGLKTLTPLSDLDIRGTLLFTANAADFDATNRIINVGLNMTVNAGTTFTSTGSTFNFNGNVAQSLQLSLNPVIFGCVNFSGNGTKTITAGSMVVNCDLNIAASCIFNASNFNLSVTGNWNNLGTFQQNCANSVTFSANGPQTIGSSAFGAVIFGGSGTKTLGGGISVCGALTINNGVTLETTTNNYSIAVGGNWTNNGTFNVNQSQVSLIGNAKTIATGGNGVGKQFYNLSVAQSTGQAATLAGNIAILNDFTVTTGTFTTGAFSVDAYGNWTVNDIFNSNNNAGLVTLRATTGNKVFKPGSVGVTYRGITVNGGATYTLTTDNLVMTNAQPLTLSNGTFKLGGLLMQMTGNITIGALATLDVDGNANLQMSNATSITNNGGNLRIVGLPGQVATVQRNGGAGNYIITQTSGTFSAKNYTIQNTNGAGLSINGGTIDATNNLSNGIFSNGAGTSYLNLNGINFADFTVFNVQFNTGPTFNVARTSGTGNITFSGSTGTLSGSSFENDDANANTGRIRWSTSAKRWTNAIGNNDWHTAGNWNPAVIPTGGDTIYIDHLTIPAATPITINITSADAIAGRLVMDRNSYGGTGNITLNVQPGRSLSVNENINILVGTSLVQANNTALVFCGGSFLNSGTYTHNNSTLTMNGTAGINSISAGASNFYNLTIAVGATADYQLSSATTILNDLSILGGSLDVTTSNYAITIGGNWNNTSPGIYYPQQGTVTFNKAGAQTMFGGPFFNLTTAGSGTKTMLTNFTVRNDLVIGASTVIDGGLLILSVARNWTNNALGGFTQIGTGTVQFNGTSAQNIDNGSQTSAFNNISMLSIGAKTIGKPFTVAGDFTILSGSGNVDFGTNLVTGTPSKMFSIAGIATVILRGANNFPSGFGTASLATNSTVQYLADISQTVFATSYGNLTLGRVTAVNNTKTLLGTLNVAGALTINDFNTQLDASNQSVFLTGNLAFPTGGRAILWGTTGTLTHNGGGWNIDVDYTGFPVAFNNLILSGTAGSTKTMLANLNVSGNVSVQNGITLTMNNLKLTGTISSSFILDAGSILRTSIPSASGIACPDLFGTYAFDCSSNFIVQNFAGLTNVTISSIPTYGNLTLNNTGTSTLNGSLNICGNLNTAASTFDDGGFNITSTGATIDLRIYTPTVTSTIFLVGGNQNIFDATSGALDIPVLICANAGIKTIGVGANSVINLLGNVSINSGVTLSITNRNVNFSGDVWQNNGTFGHYNTGSGSYFTYTGSAVQTIDMGTSNVYEHYVYFNKPAGNVNFINKGGNFTRTSAVPQAFYVQTGTVVNMGALTHNIAGTVQNDGTWNTNSSNINFNGGVQTIISPVFVANNVTISGTGAKTMGCNWQVNDLTIGANTGLNTTAAFSYGITCTGNWINNGTFTVNNSDVAFESNTAVAKVIQAGTSAFRNVTFNQIQTNARTYTLTSLVTTFNRDLTMGTGATLDLNGNSLTLGSNNAGYVETHNINVGATLNVSSNSILRINNDNGNSNINVAGTLSTIGNNTFPARITRSTGNNRINITITGTIKAQYYSYEYFSDNGMIVQPGATIDPLNNFSNGTWTFLNTAAGAPKYYLQLNGDMVPNNPITGVTFNYTGTPTIGTHFNVRRTATPTITFGELLGGVLGSFLYESDVVLPTSSATGNLFWPIPNLLTWTGATSREWNLASNWLPNQIPTVIDDVIIPDVANDPLIQTANANCKNITITNGNLGLRLGFDLYVNQNLFLGSGASTAFIIIQNDNCDITVNGSWSKNAASLFINGNKNSSVNFVAASASCTIDAGNNSPFYNINFNAPNSTYSITGLLLDIDNDLNIIDGTVLPNTANYTYTIQGDWVNNSVFSTSTTGTVNFNGTGAQSITNGVFSNLTLSGSNIKSTINTLTVSNTTQVQVGSTLEATVGSIWDLRGNVNMLGTYNDGGNTHTFTGVTWSGTGACVSNSGTILFNRIGAQTCSAGAFNSVDFNGGNSKTLAGNVTVNNDVFVRSAISFLNMATFGITSNTNTGTFLLEANATLYIRGANNSPANFGAYDFNVLSTTYYDANLNQIIGGFGYGNLFLNTANVKTLGENTSVKGNLLFNNSTLDVSTNNYTLFVSGDYNNNGSGSFICNSGEVIFDGTGITNQNIWNGTSGIKTFYDVTVNKPTGLSAVFANNNPVILNDLRIQSGTLNPNGNNVTVGGDLQASNGIIATSGRFTLNNSTGTPSNIQTNGSVLNDIVVNGPTSTFKLVDNLTTNGNFTLTAGTFDNNGYTANLGNGSETIIIDGTYKVTAGGKLGIGNAATLTVNPTGVIEVVGVNNNLATISNNLSGGRYNFVVNGTIKAQYYLFEYMSTSGIQVSNSAIIDATNNFSDGTFTNGAVNGNYLRVENTQTLLIQNTSFGFNPGGTAKNVVKITSTSGSLTFNNYLGVFSGPTFESDPNSLINWTGPITLTWNGNINSDWYTALNWTASAGPSIVPTANENAVIAVASNQPIVTLDGAVCKSLTINTGAILTLNTPFASAPDFTIIGDLLVNGIFLCQGAADTIISYGNWTKPVLGTFIPGTSTAMFSSTNSGTLTINNGTSSFNNVEFNGTSNYQLGSNTVLNGNFRLVTGSLDVTSNNYTLNVRGNWLNTATFNQRNGTVTLSGATGTYTINNGASQFFNLTINPSVGSVIYNVTANDLKCFGNTVLQTGTLNLNNFTLFNGDNVGVDAFNIFGTFNLGNNGTVRCGSSSAINVNSGGVLRMVGSSTAIRASITRQSTGNYAFNVNTGGTIQAKFYSVEYTNSNGLYIKNGGNIDPTNNLSDGIFSNGALGGSYINLENSFTDFTSRNITFNSGANYNVTRLFGSGVITLKDASGTLAGYLFENDDLSANTGLVVWTSTLPIYDWTGNALDNDWFNPGNWVDNNLNIPTFVPNDTITAHIPDVSSGSNSFPIIKTGSSFASNSDSARCFNLNIDALASVTLSNGKNMRITNSSTNAGVLTVSNGSASNIVVSNLWSNSGTFNNGGSSTVTMKAPSGIISLTNGVSSFNNLTISSGATYQTLANIDIDGNLTITSGTLQVNNVAHQLFIGGNWSNNGTFINGGGLVTFDKTSGTQTITNPSGAIFHNFKIANIGSNLKTVQLNNNLTINGNLDIFNVKCALDAGANTIDIKGNWNNNGNAFISTGTVNFIGSSNQTVKRIAAAGENFNNITVNNTNDVKLLSNVTLAGNATLTAGLLDVSSRILTINGNLAGVSGLILTSGSVYLSGVYSNTGSFTKGTSSFFYQGSGAQTIRAVDYHNLYSTSTGTRTLASTGTIGVSAVFSPGTNVYTVTGSTVNFNGTGSQVIPLFNFNNLTSSSSGSRNLSSGIIGVAGDFTPGTNSYSSAGNTLNFSGSGTQAINGNFLFFNNLTKSIGGTLNLGGNITVSSDLAINAGTINTLQYQITGNATGLFTMAASTTLTIGSTTNSAAVTWPTNYTPANTTLNCSSTQIYRANSANQAIANISPSSYGNLQIETGAAPSSKTLLGNIEVCGNLSSGANSTLNVAANTVTLSGNYIGTGNLSFTSGTFNIAGNWTNSGTATIGTSTINYNGTGTQTIGAVNYYNLTSSSTGARTLASTGTIGIANVFTPGANSYTITGSTLDFNGSVAQTIPAFNYNNLTSSGTGARTLASSGSIGVASDFTMGTGNTYTVTNSTVVFNGIAAQSTSEFTFDNITLNQVTPSSLLVNGPINIQGTMTLTSGALLGLGNDITFISTNTKTGRIAPITGGTISGDIIMQRSAPGGTTGWAWLGSCITNTTLADWYNNNTEIFMAGFPGSSSTGSSWVSVYGYNEAAPGAFSSALSYVAPTNITNPIVLGKGYWVYLGNGFSTTTDMLFDSRGTVHTGNFTFPATYTNNGLPSEDGWNLMANPYPSAIDWDNVNWTKTNVGSTYYAWNADINNYVTYTTGVGGTNGGTKDIPSSQGFYIKASGTPTLNATEAVKSVAQPNFVRVATNSNTLSGNLSIKVNKLGSLLADEAIFRFDNVDGLNTVDNLDSYKLYPQQGSSINVSTKVGNDDFTINTMQTFDHSFAMPVKFVTNNTGFFTMSIDGISNLMATYPDEFINDYLVLVDAQGNETNLSSNNSVSFAATTSDSVKNFTIRFHNPVITKAVAPIAKSYNEITISRDATGAFVDFSNVEPTNAVVNVYNTVGALIETFNLNTAKGKQYLRFNNAIAEGIYMIQVNYNGIQSVGKLKF